MRNIDIDEWLLNNQIDNQATVSVGGKEVFIADILEQHLKEQMKETLNYSVSAIYFADNSDYLSYHYEIIRTITGLDEPTDEDIKRLYTQINL